MARKKTQNGRDASKDGALSGGERPDGEDVANEDAIEDAEVVGGTMGRRADPSGARVVTPVASGEDAPEAEASDDGARDATTGGTVAGASSAAEDAPEAASSIAGAGRTDVPHVDRGEGTREDSETGRAEVEPAYATPVPQAAPAPQGGGGAGFLPLLLGGIVAGAIGYLVALFLTPAEPPVIADDGRLTALEDEIALLRADGGDDGAADALLDPLRAEQEELSSRLDAVAGRLDAIEGDAADPADVAAGASIANVPDSEVAAIRTGLDEVGTRLDAVEAAGEERTAAIDALRADLGGGLEMVRTGLGGRISGLGGRVAEVEADLEEALARADSVEEDATALAREAALNQIGVALESGAPYAEQVSVLGDAPAPLADPAGDGVAKLGDLRADFPPLAREALRSVRAELEGGGLGSLAGRFLNARSLEPREGDDPDAVLSRAEAAVRSGDLDAALSEIEALPHDARVALADWTSRAETRVAALSAFNDYQTDG